VPTVPLDRLYGEELQAWLKNHDVQVKLNCAVDEILIENEICYGVCRRDGTRDSADVCISTVPADRLLDLLRPDFFARNPALTDLRKMESSPITSVHLWFDRAITDLPHVVLIDCLSQWLFNRGGGYVQIVVSAAHELRGLHADEIQTQILDELRSLFPNLATAKLLRSKVVTEHAATFSPVPGVDARRPGPITAVPNLFLAGDWTATRWPGTMESAVISGVNAGLAATRSLRSGARFIKPSP
jgi:predicted NAD/FAD-dependent oxidoreductase